MNEILADTIHLEELADFSPVYDKYQHYTLGRMSFLTYFRPGSPRLYVNSSGARQPKSDLRKPYYNRWSWAAGSQYSHVYLNDPSPVTHGWYLGDGKASLLQQYGKLVRVLRNRTDPFTQLILAGSSMGGYASLHMSTLIPGTVVYVSNPQIVLSNYHSKNVQALEAYIGQPIKDVTMDLNKIDPGQRIIYRQVKQDTHHFKKHFTPFMEHCEAHGYSNVKVVLVNDPKGHGSFYTPEDLENIEI